MQPLGMVHLPTRASGGSAEPEVSLEQTDSLGPSTQASESKSTKAARLDLAGRLMLHSVESAVSASLGGVPFVVSGPMRVNQQSGVFAYDTVRFGKVTTYSLPGGTEVHSTKLFGKESLDAYRRDGVERTPVPVTMGPDRTI